jgi:hypothetical protein
MSLKDCQARRDGTTGVCCWGGLSGSFGDDKTPDQEDAGTWENSSGTAAKVESNVEIGQ